MAFWSGRKVVGADLGRRGISWANSLIVTQWVTAPLYAFPMLFVTVPLALFFASPVFSDSLRQLLESGDENWGIGVLAIASLVALSYAMNALAFVLGRQARHETLKFRVFALSRLLSWALFSIVIVQFFSAYHAVNNLYEQTGASAEGSFFASGASSFVLIFSFLAAIAIGILFLSDLYEFLTASERVVVRETSESDEISALSQYQRNKSFQLLGMNLYSWPIIVGCFTAAALIYANIPDPTTPSIEIDRGEHPVVIFALAGVLGALGLALLFRLRQAGFPIFGLLAIWLFATMAFGPTRHELRVLKTDVAVVKPLLQARLATWLPERGRADGAGADLYFFAAPGGGVSSAYATAAVLAQLRAEHPEIYKRVFMATGVSGGAVGAALHGLLSQPSLRDREGFDERAAITRFFSEDFFTEALWRALGPAALEAALVFADFGEATDRAVAIEEALERAFAAAISTDANEKAPPKDFTAPFFSDPSLPPMAFQGALAASGERVVVSNVRLPDLPLTRPIEALGAAPFDLRLSTAAIVSARFPLITQPAVPPKTQISISDGGFIENTGVRLAENIAAGLDLGEQRLRHGVMTFQYLSQIERFIDYRTVSAVPFEPAQPLAILNTARVSNTQYSVMEASLRLCGGCYQDLLTLAADIARLGRSFPRSTLFDTGDAAPSAASDQAAPDAPAKGVLDALVAAAEAREDLGEGARNADDTAIWTQFAVSRTQDLSRYDRAELSRSADSVPVALDPERFQRFKVFFINNVTRSAPLGWSLSRTARREIDESLPRADRCVDVAEIYRFAIRNYRRIVEAAAIDLFDQVVVKRPMVRPGTEFKELPSPLGDLSLDNDQLSKTTAVRVAAARLRVELAEENPELARAGSEALLRDVISSLGAAPKAASGFVARPSIDIERVVLGAAPHCFW